MVYDPDLAGRIRELIGGEAGVIEQRMFGGLAFLLDGKMAIAASSEGGILVRVDPHDSERLVGSGRAVAAIMRGRSMRGWLRVAPEQIRTKRQLAPWVQRGMNQARASAPRGPGHQ